MSDRTLRPGAVLYLEGEAVEHVWYVKRGVVSLSRAIDGRGASTAVWALRRAGSMIGLESLVGPAYLDTARAVGEVAVCSATPEAVRAWVATRPEAAMAVIGCTLEGQRNDGPRRSGADGTASTRVASWLLGRTESKPVPRRVVADLLGMEPETLSRTLKALAAKHLVRVTRTSIEIIDRAGLERVSGSSARASSSGHRSNAKLR